VRRTAAWTLLFGLGLLAAPAPSLAEEKKAEVATVEIAGERSRVPAGWKEQPTTSRMRLYQFKIPAAKGDKDDAEMIVFHFKGGAGSAEANVKRWKEMFVPPEGKTIDEATKVETFKVGETPVTYADVRGTYRYKARPFDPTAKAELRPDYRLLGVVFESEKGQYFFRLVGPAATVAANKKGFEDWVKGLK